MSVRAYLIPRSKHLKSSHSENFYQLTATQTYRTHASLKFLKDNQAGCYPLPSHFSSMICQVKLDTDPDNGKGKKKKHGGEELDSDSIPICTAIFNSSHMA